MVWRSEKGTRISMRGLLQDPHPALQGETSRPQAIHLGEMFQETSVSCKPSSNRVGEVGSVRVLGGTFRLSS
jgi:hypothetical protein